MAGGAWGSETIGKNIGKENGCPYFNTKPFGGQRSGEPWHPLDSLQIGVKRGWKRRNHGDQPDGRGVRAGNVLHGVFRDRKNDRGIGERGKKGGLSQRGGGKR